MAQSLEPVSNSVSISLCSSPAHILFLSLKNKHLQKNFFKEAVGYKYEPTGMTNDF